MGKKKEDLTEDNAAHMEAKYVRLQENTTQPDPEVMEAQRKHVDMKKGEEKKKELKEEDEKEAGNMEAKTPNKKGDMDELMKAIESMKSDFSDKFDALKTENEALKNDIVEINSEKTAQEELVKNDLIDDMSQKYMVPQAWLKTKDEKYGKGDFITDLYEGLSFAFGTLPGYEVEAAKGDMANTGKLLKKVAGLEMM